MLLSEIVNERRALFTAPIAIFPVALVFVSLRSLMAGDMRELFVAPLSAGAITLVGYPFAIAAGWAVAAASSKFAHKNLALILAASAISAEVIFWLVISPFWQRDFSIAFCLALVGACGLACGAAFYWLVRRQSARGN